MIFLKSLCRHFHPLSTVVQAHKHTNISPLKIHLLALSHPGNKHAQHAHRILLCKIPGGSNQIGKFLLLSASIQRRSHTRLQALMWGRVSKYHSIPARGRKFSVRILFRTKSVLCTSSLACPPKIGNGPLPQRLDHLTLL